jgi:hypothetical protein
MRHHGIRERHAQGSDLLRDGRWQRPSVLFSTFQSCGIS